jgi:hypothetical protein
MKAMEQKIAPCGNDCSVCPRYTAQSTEDLQKVAELWYKVGWRDKIVCPEEIKCSGCSSHKSCSHGVIDCIREKCVQNCSQCSDFPCDKIDCMLEKTKRYEQRCRALCSDAEFMILKKAFFEKDNNLTKIDI